MALILVIEDNPELQEFLKVALGTEGLEVVAALDGKEGLDAAAARKPDLIILDMMLPTMNGLQVIRALKADPALKAVPVIVTTAYYSDVEFLESALRSEGAVEYLRKPVKVDELLLAVKKNLAPRA